MARRKSKIPMSVWRNPAFYGGLCACCGIRPRNNMHAAYPNMCDKCRNTRVRNNTPMGNKLPIEVQRRIKENDAKMLALLDTAPRQLCEACQGRMAEPAGRFCTTCIAKEKVHRPGSRPSDTLEQQGTNCGIQTLNERAVSIRERVADSAARFRATQKTKS